MQNTTAAFLAVNEAILLIAAERACIEHAGGRVEVDLPLEVRTDTAAREIIVIRRDTGAELYRLSHPQAEPAVG